MDFATGLEHTDTGLAELGWVRTEPWISEQSATYAKVEKL